MAKIEDIVARVGGVGPARSFGGQCGIGAEKLHPLIFQRMILRWIRPSQVGFGMLFRGEYQ